MPCFRWKGLNVLSRPDTVTMLLMHAEVERYHHVMASNVRSLTVNEPLIEALDVEKLLRLLEEAKKQGASTGSKLEREQEP